MPQKQKKAKGRLITRWSRTAADTARAKELSKGETTLGQVLIAVSKYGPATLDEITLKVLESVKTKSKDFRSNVAWDLNHLKDLGLVRHAAKRE